MHPSVKEENGTLVCVKDNHNEPVLMVMLDKNIPFSEIFLCSKCYLAKQTVSYNNISLQQAKQIIDEKLSSEKSSQQENTKQALKNILEFQLKIKELRSQKLQLFDQVLWTTESWLTTNQNTENNSDSSNLIEQLRQLHLNNPIQEKDQDVLKNSNQSYRNKIESALQKLSNPDDYKMCLEILNRVNINVDQENKQILPGNNLIKSAIAIGKSQQQESNQSKVIPLCPIKYQYVDSEYQGQLVFAIAFNSSGERMVAGSKNDIIVWKFNRGRMFELIKLEGHTEYVNCLLFSKRCNWFVSGSNDQTIRCWKEQGNNVWNSTQPFKEHTNSVIQILLNNKEDQLISCSYDQKILVWKLNCNSNQLVFDYKLEEKHVAEVYSISLNESETALVSCSEDKSVILWGKGNNQKWSYQNDITMDDYGFRLCFISDTQIAWQQRHQGFTHILKIENGKLKDQPELKIKLNEANDDCILFHTIFNKEKQIMIQKHNKHVYIIRKQQNGQFKIEQEPIDCKDYRNFGALTNNGEYLLIWSYDKFEFKSYKISQG